MKKKLWEPQRAFVYISTYIINIHNIRDQSWDNFKDALIFK